MNEEAPFQNKAGLWSEFWKPEISAHSEAILESLITDADIVILRYGAVKIALVSPLNATGSGSALMTAGQLGPNVKCCFV